MALGGSTFSLASGAVGDLFAASGDRSKAQYDFAEAKNYGIAGDLATQNEQFTETSTAIKEVQQQREAMHAYGGVQASVAGAGFTEGGSALDILRDSASQGALTHAVLGQQGLITEAGYKEQAQSYQTMQAAATQAGNAENEAATGATITGILKGVGAIASLALAPETGGLSLAGLGGLFGGSSGGFTPEAPSDAGNPLVINQYGSPGPVNNNPLGGLY